MDEELQEFFQENRETVIKTIANRYGSALAKKASPALMLSLAMPEPAREGFESLLNVEIAAEVESGEVPTSSAIIEFVGGEQTGRESTQLQLAPCELDLREKEVESRRREFEQTAREVRSHLLSRTTARESRSNAIDTCWLIRAIQSPLDGEALAGVAEHPAVTAIDVPHRIQRDARPVIIGLRMSVDKFQHDTHLSGKGIIVAVIDGEVVPSHTHFQDRVTLAQNYTPEPFGQADDHASSVAGIIGANSEFIVGIAPEAQIRSYKIFRTMPGMTNDFAGAKAIQQALEDGAQIANCSWGAGPASDGTSREARACDTAWALGLIIVKSAGNNGPAPNTLTTPADASGVIVVGATTLDGKRVASYSSRGTVGAETRPHFVALGGGETETLTSVLHNGNVGPCGIGTSFAAPHASGTAALLLQRKPQATPNDIRAEMLTMCHAIAGVPKMAQGAGLLVLR
jgi:serine protease AprX